MQIPEVMYVKEGASIYDESGNRKVLSSGEYPVVDFIWGDPTRPGESWWIVRSDNEDFTVDADDRVVPVALARMEKVVAEMRSWLLDCGCDEELLDSKTDDEVKREVERLYEGGLEGFMREMI